MTAEQIIFRCGKCGKSLLAPATDVGRTVACPACARAVRVPRIGSNRASGGDGSSPSASAPTPPAPVRADKPPVAHSTAGLLLLGLILGLTLIAFVFGNLVTRLFVALMLITALNGYWMGATRITATLLGMLLAVPLAAPVGRLLEGFCSSIFGATGLLNRMIAVGVGAVVVILVIGAALTFPFKAWLKKRPAWKKADRFAGSILGAAEGVVLGAFLIWAVLVIEPVAARHLAEVEASQGRLAAHQGARWIARSAAAVRDSAVGRAAGVANPLKELRIFRFFEEAQTVLNDTRMRERFVNHPNMKAIAELPSIKKAQQLLLENAQIVNFEDGLSNEELRTLLQHPRFLEILDETKLLAELGPIAYQIEEAFNAAFEETPPAASP